jgi:hypothetical protein
MRRLNVIVIAGLLAVAAVLGTVAASRTVSLGASARHVTAASVQTRAKRLDAFEASLHRALDRKPPALPAVPEGTVAAAAPRVVYHRPPPVVVVTHAHHGDDGGYEHEGGEGDD